PDSQDRRSSHPKGQHQAGLQKHLWPNDAETDHWADLLVTIHHLAQFQAAPNLEQADWHVYCSAGKDGRGQLAQAWQIVKIASSDRVRYTPGQALGKNRGQAFVNSHVVSKGRGERRKAEYQDRHIGPTGPKAKQPPKIKNADGEERDPTRGGHF